MNFVAICLHCLDMRDFHSHMRETPFMDELRKRSIFIPMGRAHGHNNRDSQNAELTGQWTARFCDSKLTRDVYIPQTKGNLPKTLNECLADAGYDIITCQSRAGTGNAAAPIGMANVWLRDEPERMKQFTTVEPETLDDYVEMIRESAGRGNRFFANVFLRETHRPWAQVEGLCALAGRGPAGGWPHDAFCARKASLEHPDEFAALRRRGLTMADERVRLIVEGTQDLKDVTYIVYSNHGEVFDHFRYNRPHKNTNSNLIVGVSHGPYPYEVLYANMQMWMVPGEKPRVMNGIGRLIDHAPTVMELAGVEHGPMDGESMLGYFAQGVFPMRPRYGESGLIATGSCLSMVDSHGFKLISMTPEPLPQDGDEVEYHKLAVFDLTSDPWEYVNIIDTDKGQEVLNWAVSCHAELTAIQE